MNSLGSWNDTPVAVIKQTHLSTKPARGSGIVALVSLGFLLLVSSLYWSDALGLGDQLPASGETVFQQQEYWRLWTSIGAHGDLSHFLSNSIAFALLAFLLFGYYGSIAYPVGALGLGAVVTAVALHTYPPSVSLVGASGVVYLMAAFWLTLYLLVERRFSVPKRLVRAVGFGLILLAPTAVEPTVSYRSHGLGFLVGALFAIAFFAKQKRKLRSAETVRWE